MDPCLLACQPVPETFKLNKVNCEFWLDLAENLTKNRNRTNRKSVKYLTDFRNIRKYSEFSVKSF